MFAAAIEIKKKNHSLVPQIYQISFLHFKMSSNPQRDMLKTVRRTQKAINTINRFVQYSEGLRRKTDPEVRQSHHVFREEPHFRPGGLLV